MLEGMKKIKTIKDFKTKYTTTDVDIFLSEYADGSGQPALVANDATTGEPVSAFTVNLIGYGIVPDVGNVIISDYSENEGIFDELFKHGIVGEELDYHIFGFNASAKEAKLLVD